MSGRYPEDVSDPDLYTRINALREVASSAQDPSVRRAAIGELAHDLDELADDEAAQFIVLNNLAANSLQLYAITGELADLENGIEWGEDYLDAGADGTKRFEMVSNLGIAYGWLFQRTADDIDREWMIEFCREALSAYNYQGDHDDEKAYQYFDRVAKILSHGADIPANVALGALMGLGNGMMSVGELDAAERNLKNALSLAAGMHGEHSHDAAQVHALLAWVHHRRGDQVLADAEMSMAIDVISDLFGADHPYTRRLTNRREEWRTSPQPEDP